jgi:hypothetical protein
MFFWRAYAVPLVRDDVHESIRTMESQELISLFRPAFGSGLAPRWHGSFYYPTKIPDPIGFKDRKYLDHSATHQHRVPGDLMRYAALVSYSDVSDFGPHRLLSDEQRKIPSRLPDEALYALARYIYSLEPPPNPHKFDERAATGQLFEQRGCAGCHTPPLYTNNKLTLAGGFTPPKEHFQFLDIQPVSVGTDPGLALKTRKGTGYYKVPWLKGLWYRAGISTTARSRISRNCLIRPVCGTITCRAASGRWAPRRVRSRATSSGSHSRLKSERT